MKPMDYVMWTLTALNLLSIALSLTWRNQPISLRIGSMVFALLTVILSLLRLGWLLHTH